MAVALVGGTITMHFAVKERVRLGIENESQLP